MMVGFGLYSDVFMQGLQYGCMRHFFRVAVTHEARDIAQ
jgi:hypothetical protein